MAATKKTTKAAKVAEQAVETVIEKVEEKATAADKVEKKPAKKPAAKKTTLKSTISVQFAGKSYTNEDLVKIAKDVWQYDLKKEEKDLKSVDLYVKPEESTVYYVFNGTEEGCFGI
ncbi:MAG: hypothetical protein IKV27_07955 [Lachnospiraceae bacterium]|nr:hypothetical protein [Lachnospiraceae bacterium]